MKYVVVTTLTVLACGIGSAFAGPIWLIPTGSFDLNRYASGGIAVDETTVYVTFTGQPEMDTYDLSGNFLGTIPLTGCETYLGGYTGATIKDEDELYLTAMFPPGRDSAVYTVTKTGTCVNQAILLPRVANTTSIAFDGGSAYLGQNDDPYYAYRANPDTGAVLQTYASNPGHGQRLGMAYWATGGLLIESYDSGVSVLDPADGSELQYLGPDALGHYNQNFGAEVVGDTLYLLINAYPTSRVLTFTIVPTTAYLVCPDGSGDFLTIQEGIDAASDGDEVVVCDGTYTGDGNRDLDFGGKPITVRSANGPGNCIIDCEGSAGDPHRGFHFHSGEASYSVVRGFTITNGFAAGAPPQSGGGGILCEGSSPTVTDCTFSGNSAQDGGGMGIYGPPGGPWVADCTFSGNTAWGSGGGVFCFSGEFEFGNCTFHGNASPLGGGIYGGDSSFYMENCIIAFSTQGAAVECGDAETGLYCCDVFGNAGGDWVGCIAGQLGVEGNISEDPLFCDPENEDFHIHIDSPCAPESNPECGLIGAWPTGCCPADLDGDDDTDLSDLSTLLAGYGSSIGDPNYNPNADFDGDGDIDLSDLAFLLGDYACGT